MTITDNPSPEFRRDAPDDRPEGAIVPPRQPLSAEEREQYILAHRGMVKRLAIHLMRVYHKNQGVFDDLCGAGELALVEAAAGFDKSRGVSFSTYAGKRIRGGMLDSFAGVMASPQKRRHFDKIVYEIRKDLVASGVAAADLEEKIEEALCAREDSGENLGLVTTRENIRAALEGVKFSAIDDLSPSDLGRLARSGGENPEKVLIRHDPACARAFERSNLRPLERQILDLHFGNEDMSFTDIGEALGIHRQTAFDVKEVALKKLRAAFNVVDSGPEPLTDREQEILGYIEQGLTPREIKSKTGLSTPTFNTHKLGIYKKLGVNSEPQLYRKLYGKIDITPQHAAQWALTDTERDVLQHSLDGESPEEIGAALGYKAKTVYEIRTRIYEKMHIPDGAIKARHMFHKARALVWGDGEGVESQKEMTRVVPAAPETKCNIQSPDPR